MTELAPETAEAKEMELAATRRHKKSTNIPGPGAAAPAVTRRDKSRLRRSGVAPAAHYASDASIHAEPTTTSS